MKKLLLYLLITFGTAIVCGAQTPAPPTPTPWVFSTSAGYSNVTNAPTNNGFANVTELRLANHFALRGDVFLMTNPQVIGSYISGEGIWKIKSGGAFSATPIEIIASAGAGDLRSSDPTNTTKAKFSWRAGAGINIQLSDKTFLRPLDISYLRGSVFQNGGTIVGNHMQVTAQLGVRF